MSHSDDYTELSKQQILGLIALGFEEVNLALSISSCSEALTSKKCKNRAASGADREIRAQLLAVFQLG